MAEADKQQVALEVLKGLNAAVKTTKLYPPHFPQVGNAFENAFTQVTEYLRRYGELSFSLVDDDPKLCGLPVSQKTLGRIHGEDIYQQLRLLQFEHLVLDRQLSQAVFKQLLVFFTTSPQLVNREGGGRSFVANLGLSTFFPDEYAIEVPEERKDYFAASLSRLREEHRAGGELIRSLSSVIDGETVAGQKRISSFAALKKEQPKLVDLIFATIAHVLQGGHRIGEISFPGPYETILRNVNRLTSEQERQQLAQAVASACLRHLDAFALHTLILQPHPRGFGAALYKSLVTSMTTDFDEVVRLIREEEAVVAGNAGEFSEQYRQLSAGLERLFATDKGKQFLVREKARKLLEAGEKERQAKRIQAGIRAILSGDVNSLKNKEVISHLPSTIESLIARGKDNAAATIITSITTELMKGDERSHDLLSECLSRIGERLINASKWGWLEKLSIPLMTWLKEADKVDQALENIVDILLKLTKYYWKNDKEKKADKILKLFFAIRTGKLEKDAEVVETIGRLQDMSVEKAPLPDLLERSVEEDNELVDRRLIMQGPLVARFLLNTLLRSENTEVRLKVLELLKRMGPLLAPLLIEKLKEPMPWHGKRNLLKLLSQVGSEKDAAEIFDYLDHEDIRVQQEAFACIHKLSGEDRKSNLLEALTMATGPMKEQVVRALVPMADQQVTAAVAGLLEDWQYFSEDVRNPLLIQIVTLLGKSSSQTAEDALEDFLRLEGRGKAKNIDEDVWQSAKQALRHLKMHRRELSKRQYLQTLKESGGYFSDNDTPQEAAAPRRSEYVEEAQIESLIRENDIDRARKVLVELIARSASIQRFDEAERLREWLIEIAPSALNDIIRTAETIEEAKRENISSDFLQVWSGLYDNLSTEEFNALYYSMEHRTFFEEEQLVNQGDMYPALFFVNQGKIKLFYDDRDTEILINVVEQGQIFGTDTFFDASLWTASAIALVRAEVSILPLDNTRKWSREHPALESKLHDLSQNFSTLASQLEESKKSRREHRRNPAEGTVLASLLDKNGREEGVQMKGEFADLSRGGLSFLMRISAKSNARILLGRSMRLQLPSDSAQGKATGIDGVLVNVRSTYSMNNDYAVHVRFNRLLTDAELQGILEAGKVGSP